MLIEINTNVSVFSHNFAFLEPLSVILNIYGVRINVKCISVVHFKERRPLHFSTLQYSILITSDIDNDNHTE